MQKDFKNTSTQNTFWKRGLVEPLPGQEVPISPQQYYRASSLFVLFLALFSFTTLFSFLLFKNQGKELRGLTKRNEAYHKLATTQERPTTLLQVISLYKEGKISLKEAHSELLSITPYDEEEISLILKSSKD